MGKALMLPMGFLFGWTVLGLIGGADKSEVQFFAALTVLLFCTFAIVRTIESQQGGGNER